MNIKTIRDLQLDRALDWYREVRRVTAGNPTASNKEHLAEARYNLERLFKEFIKNDVQMTLRQNPP
jgi:hypothetical protein